MTYKIAANGNMKLVAVTLEAIVKNYITFLS